MLTRTCDGGRPIEAAPDERKGIEPAKRGLEEPRRTAPRSTPDVMVRGRELNEPLQELLDVRLRRQPELFPRLVRLPVALRVEVLDSFVEARAEVGFFHVLSSRFSEFVAGSPAKA